MSEDAEDTAPIPPIRQLITTASDADAAVRRRALAQLVMLGASAVLPIAEIIWSEGGNHTEIGGDACQALRMLGDVGVSQLVRVLADAKKNYGLRVKAACALGCTGDRQATAALTAALSDPEDGVRSWAARGLYELADERAAESLVAALKDPYDEVRYPAALALGKVGAGQIQAIIELLTNADRAARWAAAIALGRLDDRQGVGPLIRALDDPIWEVRLEIVTALGRLGDPRAVQPLIARLADEHVNVQARAAEMLGRLSNTQALPSLLRIQETNRDRTRGGRTISKAAAEAIEKIKQAAPPIDPAIALLKEGDSEQRAWAARVLNQLSSQQAQEALTAALDDPSTEVRYIAALALSKLGDSSHLFLESLIQALSDAASTVRGDAAEALGMLGNPNAVDALIPLLTDEHTDVCRRAALALGQLGSPRALPALRQMQEMDTRTAPKGVKLSKAATKAMARIEAKQQHNQA